VEEWLSDVQPDVVCLQETKLADSAFPAMSFSSLGYDSVHHGEGRWNGVAILSRVGLEGPELGFGPNDDDPQARLVWATCGGVRVASAYVPNGRSLDDDHYTYKLAWLSKLRTKLEQESDPQQPLIIAGDYNIAPSDVDVYDPSKFVGATHTSEPEREALGELLDWGLVDTFRELEPADKIYSWWDYRGGDFHMHRGMRIDLVLATRTLSNAAHFATVDRQARKGDKPSDHAPVIIDFDL
ncbi:MAG: exodeoxyribonuclease III, partial [Acidimicrobiales bacterium]|nr:exodeoxyribonuclease III [Acidimicrobiales bacterium]